MIFHYDLRALISKHDLITRESGDNSLVDIKGLFWRPTGGYLDPLRYQEQLALLSVQGAFVATVDPWTIDEFCVGSLA
jgi:hypothetical protein